MTKREIQKLIKQISKATYDPTYGEDFAKLLSAMRGPDDDAKTELKADTTGYIRSVVNWQCGITHDHRHLKVSDWYKMMDRTDVVADCGHFISHIRGAVRSLSKFGLIKGLG